MEEKKSHKAYLESKRSTMFLLGLVLVLSLFIVVMEYDYRSDPFDDSDWMEEISHDIELMPSFELEEPVATIPQQQQEEITTKLNVVEETVEEDAEDEQKEDRLAESELADMSEKIEEMAPPPPVSLEEEENPLDFQIVERIPEFPGGMAKFMKWLTQNLKYPTSAKEKKIQGKVLVAFIVNKDGTIADPKVVQAANPMLDKEALRVIRMMPNWKAGEDRGKPCRTYICIPVVFKL